MDNIHRSIVDRILYEKRDGVDGLVQPADRAIFNRRLMPFKWKLLCRVPTTIPLTRPAWVERFRGDRRYNIYKQLLEPDRLRPASRSDSNIQTFVKMEKTFLASDSRYGGKVDPVPRPIQPRNPRYRMDLGRFIVPAEKNIYKAINKVFGFTAIGKSLGNDEKGDLLWKYWMMFDDPVAFKVDAHRFDAHIGGTALEWEHSIYLEIFKGLIDTDELRDLLSWQLDYRVDGHATDGHLRWRGRVRATGDPNTGCGNTLLSAAMWWTFLHNTRFRALFDGDDGIIILNRGDAAIMGGVGAWFTPMGMVMTVEPMVDHFNRLLFCGCRPIHVDGGTLMVRDFWPALAKDTHSMTNLSSRVIRESWFSSVGSAGIAIAGGVPVIQELYVKYKEWGSGRCRDDTIQENRALWLMSQDMVSQRQYGIPTEQVRVEFFKAFGIDPCQQLALETKIRALPKPVDIVDVRDAPSDPAYLMGTCNGWL